MSVSLSPNGGQPSHAIPVGMWFTLSLSILMFPFICEIDSGLLMGGKYIFQRISLVKTSGVSEKECYLQLSLL